MTKGIKVRFKNGSEGYIEYVYLPDTKTTIALIVLAISMITGGVLAANRLAQVPVNTRRLDRIERQMIRSCADQAAARVLSEKIVLKMYGPDAAEVIIRQSKEMSESMEREMNNFLNPKAVK